MKAGEHTQCLKRIAVVGTSGSGKTTLASRIAERLAIPHIELDALHWGPDWEPAPREVFRTQVAQALAGDRWAVDGNYSVVRDIVWGRADTVVWLDFPWHVVMGRVTWRTIRRSLSRRELWNGNRERFSQAFFDRDSIILWALQTYSRRRKEYPSLLDQPQFQHLRNVKLSSPRAAREWLDTLPAPSRG
jgi:adenylate kinase family enzyme